MPSGSQIRRIIPAFLASCRRLRASRMTDCRSRTPVPGVGLDSAVRSDAFTEVIRVLAAAPAHGVVTGARLRRCGRGVLARVVLALAPELHRPRAPRVVTRAQIAA